MKGTGKASDTNITRGTENAPSLALARELYTFYNELLHKSKECLNVVPDALLQFTF